MFKKTRLPRAAIAFWLATFSLFPVLKAQAADGLYMLSSMGNSDLLVHALKTETPGNPFKTPIERHCLAFGLYHEARGEIEHGQLAVGATILNRVRSSAYPNTICGVVYQNAHKVNSCQFSFACDDLSDKPRNAASYAKMMVMADRLISGHQKKRTSVNATVHPNSLEYTHYHRHDVSPFWSEKLHHLGRIGDHVFFRSERVVRRYRDKI